MRNTPIINEESRAPKKSMLLEEIQMNSNNESEIKNERESSQEAKGKLMDQMIEMAMVAQFR